MVTLPITQLIEKMNHGREAPMTFADFKQELQKRDEAGNPYYYLNLKEDDQLAIVYYDESPHPQDQSRDPLLTQVEQQTRSVILDQQLMAPIASQFNRILYNEEAVSALQDVSWDQVVVQPCYEGTILLVFYHHDRWYVTTRRCLDAHESTWIKSRSYRQMFDEAIKGKFSLDDLDRDHCYYFVLVHHLNKNIVSYRQFGKMYKEVVHIMTTRKYSCEEVNLPLPAGVVTPEAQPDYPTLENLLQRLGQISQQDEKNRWVSTEGFVLRVYSGEVKKSNFQIMKLQSQLYQHLMKLKPNNSNIHQSYLELYQRDQLRDFLPFVSRNRTEIIKRINQSMRNMATEILNLYHGTRKKKNPEVYSALTEQYRRVLYGLHGIYISNRKKSFENKAEEGGKSSSITVHDVYFYIKNLPAEQLRQLFFERWMMISSGKADQFFQAGDMYIQVQTILMFKHLLDQQMDQKSSLVSQQEEKHLPEPEAELPALNLVVETEESRHLAA